MTRRPGFRVDLRSCTGCKACQIACQDKHALPPELRWRRVVEVSGGDWEVHGQTWIDLPAESVVSMNMWGFTPSLFEELEAGFAEFLKDRGTDPKSEYFLPERVGDLVAAGRARVNVLQTEERWFGITYKEDKPFVEKAVHDLVERGVYPPSLWDA